METGVKMKTVLEENQATKQKLKGNMTKIEVPSFMNNMGKGMKIGMVNMDEDNVSDWKIHGETIPIYFERVSEYFKWEDLFPEWIDEEEELEGTSCPEIPMPDFKAYDDMDIIVAKLPCKYPQELWNREVFRLQVHLIAANLAVKKGRRDWSWKTKVVFWSRCRPMLELFRCDELVRQEGDWWLYEPQMWRLEQKVSLPIGSCRLALPLWGKGITVFLLIPACFSTHSY